MPDIETRLLPCPFCGGPVNLEQTIAAKSRHSDEWWGVVCRNTMNLGGTCAISQTPSRTKEAAITRWNTRALSSGEGGEEDVEKIARAAYDAGPPPGDPPNMPWDELTDDMREAAIYFTRNVLAALPQTEEARGG